MGKNLEFPTWAWIVLSFLLIVASVTMSTETQSSPVGATFFRPTSITGQIINTQADTIEVPQTLQSKWTYTVEAQTSAVSGVRNLKIYLDETNVQAGNKGWLVVDSMAVTGRAARMKGEVYGIRQRLRVVGVGTQNTKYELLPIYKKY
jgi:hypothetical protein